MGKYGRRPNGSGSVTKLSGNRRKPWMARVRLYDSDGSSYLKVIGCYETKTDAQKALLSPETTLNNNITFSELYSVWSEQHYRNISESSMRGYMLAYKYCSAIYGKRVVDIRPAMLQGIINGVSDKGLSRSSMVLIKTFLGLIFKYAEENDIIAKNYAKFIRIPHAEAKQREVFTESEIETYRKDDSETSRILLMLIYSGMRIGELMSIKMDDIHLSEGYVVGGEKTEAGKNRVIPIHNSVKSYWIDFIEHAENGLLFRTAEHNALTPNRYRKHLAKLQMDLGLPQKSPHSARHTCASLLAKEGVPPVMIQKILGHKSYAITAETYTHIDANKLLAELNRI